MTSRREFLQRSGAMALASHLPLTAFPTTLPQVRSRLIPGTQETLPIIGLGNSRAFLSGDMEVSSQLLDTFVSRGGAYVDVSGSSRFTVGKIVAERGYGQRTFLGNYLSGQDANALRLEIGNLQRVQGDGPLDLAMKRDVADLGRRADQFRALKEDGLVRYVGIGRPNKRFYPSMMKLIDAGAVDFVQVNYSLLETEAADEIIPMAIDRGVAVVINRPFMNGDYFSIVQGQELPEWAQEFDCVSWAQFTLKYILSLPGVNCVLTETANPKHAIDNLGAGFGRLPNQKTREKMLTLMRSLA